MTDPSSCSGQRHKNRIALVTGAAGGIGRAICERLRSEGAIVYAADIMLQRDNSQVFDGAANYLKLDVTSEVDWAEAMTAIHEKHGHLDILVNNAGIYAPQTLNQETKEGFVRLFEINQFGPFWGMRCAMPLLRRGGAIVNISSTAGIIGTPSSIGYSATKWALRGLTRSAAKQFAASGVRVNTVCPGAIDAPTVYENTDEALARFRELIPLGDIGEADDVAAATSFLASHEAKYITGAEIIVDGGWTA